jgi:peptide/nickel transport system substrate-binding protein
MFRRWLFAFPLAAILALATADGNAADPKPGGTLVVGVEGLIGFLDPHISNSGLTHNINEQIYEKLFARDYTKPNDGTPPEILPRLATGYEVSPDGLVYTIKLREGVKFHDGSDFNAQAVEFNIRRMWDKNFEYFFKDGASSLAVYVYGSLKDIQVVDDHTIKLVLSKPFSFFIEELADSIGLGLPWMVSPEAVKKYGNDGVKDHPTGTGPFRFVEEVKGERVVLEKNPDYWAKPYPYLDRLIFRPIPDPAARANALAAGEVDLINAVAPDQIETLEQDGFVVAKGPTPHIWYVEFNHSEKPFSDVRVRQAVNLAIDREGMARDLLRGTALPAICFCGRTSPTFNPPPTWAGYEYNPEKAKKLLAEAGYPNGFKTVFETSTAGSGQILPVAMGEWIQRDLAKIGIEMELRTFEWNTYGGRWYAGLEPGVGMNQISTGSNSDYWLFLVSYSKEQANSGHHTDTVYDDFLFKANGATDLAVRKQAILDAVKREKDEAHHAPIVNDTFPVAMNSKVQGFVRAADWPTDYRIVWVQE